MGKSPVTNNDTENSTMYLEYPPTKPFINDDYERPPYKPVNSYPEGNRKSKISTILVWKSSSKYMALLNINLSKYGSIYSIIHEKGTERYL